MVDLSESQTKTAKSCFNMYKKWIAVKEPEKKNVALYIKDCIGGYPRNTKIKPSLLKSRLKGLVNYSLMKPETISLSEKELGICNQIIDKYRTQLKNDTD